MKRWKHSSWPKWEWKLIHSYHVYSLRKHVFIITKSLQESSSRVKCANIQSHVEINVICIFLFCFVYLFVCFIIWRGITTDSQLKRTKETRYLPWKSNKSFIPDFWFDWSYWRIVCTEYMSKYCNVLSIELEDGIEWIRLTKWALTRDSFECWKLMKRSSYTKWSQRVELPSDPNWNHHRWPKGKKKIVLGNGRPVQVGFQYLENSSQELFYFFFFCFFKPPSIFHSNSLDTINTAYCNLTPKI